MKFPSLSVFCCAIVVLSAANAYAAPDAKKKAMDLLVQNKPADACAVLDSYYAAGNTEETVLFLRARCKRDLKEYDQSLGYYQKLVDVSPASYQARIELAEAYMRAGQKQKADDEYNHVLQMKPPAAIALRARNGLDNKLAAQKNWYARIEGGVMYDTNINAGPSNDQMVIFGAPVVLSGSSMKKQSLGYSGQIDAGYLYPINASTGFLARTSINSMNYQKDNDYDLNTYRLDLGPVYSKGRSSTSLLANGMWRTLGGDTYDTSVGATLRSTYRTTGHLIVGGSLAAIATGYPDVSGREGTVATFSPDLTYNFSPSLVGTAAGILRWDDAAYDIYKNNGTGFYLGLSKDVMTRVRSSVGFQYVNSDYKGEQPAFANIKREDNQYAANARLDWDISDYSWDKTSISLKYQYIHNDSNIPLYDFERHITMLTVSKGF